MNFQDPTSQKRLEFMVARAMGRTHAELMHGISDHELMDWRALYEVEAEEAEQAAKR
jgi:hypothetical protein